MAPRLLLVDLRDREADVDQHPVAGPDAPAVDVEQPDVDRCAARPRHRPSPADAPRRRPRQLPGMARHIRDRAPPFGSFDDACGSVDLRRPRDATKASTNYAQRGESPLRNPDFQSVVAGVTSPELRRVC